VSPHNWIAFAVETCAHAGVGMDEGAGQALDGAERIAVAVGEYQCQHPGLRHHLHHRAILEAITACERLQDVGRRRCRPFHPCRPEARPPVGIRHGGEELHPQIHAAVRIGHEHRPVATAQIERHAGAVADRAAVVGQEHLLAIADQTETIGMFLERPSQQVVDAGLGKHGAGAKPTLAQFDQQGGQIGWRGP